MSGGSFLKISFAAPVRLAVLATSLLCADNNVAENSDVQKALKGNVIKLLAGFRGQDAGQVVNTLEQRQKALIEQLQGDF